jgi:hypothetical protein
MSKENELINLSESKVCHIQNMSLWKWKANHSPGESICKTGTKQRILSEHVKPPTIQ